MKHFFRGMTRYVVMSLFLTSSLRLAAAPSGGDNERQDSLASKSGEIFSPTQLIVPASLIAIGSWGVSNGYLKHINNSVKSGMSHLRGQHYIHADDYIQYLPVAAYIALDFTGVKAKHSLRERIAAGATAYIAMAAAVNSTKYLVKEMRPDGSARNSFPSGHSATAFTGAELVRIEYGTVPRIVSYSIATGVAFLRLYNERHWLNDVIAGAGVGILSAKLGYWMLPLYRKWFHWDNGKSSSPMLVISPSYDNTSQSVSLALSCQF